MSGIVFAPQYNTHGKHDASGAFQPEASRFAKLHRAELVLIDNRRSKADMREQVLTALAKTQHHNGTCCADDSHDHRLEFAAFFCHGWSTGIQFGFNLGNVAQLAGSIAAVSNDDPIVPLYACSTASTTRVLSNLGKGPGGDGGFADELRDALCRAGAKHCTVDAHTTKGHTTWNPNVRRFNGEGSPVGGIGGQWIVKRGHELWRPWVRSLRDDMRFRFPFMSIGSIHEELAE